MVFILDLGDWYYFVGKKGGNACLVSEEIRMVDVPLPLATYCNRGFSF